MNKKGDTRVVQDILIGVIAGLIFLGIFIAAKQGFGAILPGVNEKANCENSILWTEQRALNSILKDIDSGENYAEFLFFNDNCNIISFSITQGIPEISYPGIQPTEPTLCMCNIEREFLSRQAECIPFDCYSFKSFDQINDKQLNTENLNEYVFLKFRREGKTLNIEAISDEKEPEQIIYKKSVPTQFDPEGFINKLKLKFSTNRIKSFVPIIKIKETGFITPREIANVDGFTTLFDLDIVLPPSSGQRIDAFLSNPDVIDPSLVRSAEIEINFPKEKYNKLTELQKSQIALYYKKGNSWAGVPLLCGEVNSEILCKASLNEFSGNFVVSTMRILESYTSTTEKEAELSQFIHEISASKGVDPLFVKSIIKIESNWIYNVVSPCGAAGLVQLMPHTARGMGLAVIDPVNGVEFIEERGNSCSANAPYGQALKQFAKTRSRQQLIAADDRFNERKAIETSINYILTIKKILENRNVPPTLENIATAYNAGPYSKIVGSPSRYSKLVMDVYNNARVSSFISTDAGRVWPVEDPTITSCFGSRFFSLHGDADWHDGLDFGIPVGTPIKAIASGTVHSLCSTENCNLISDSSCLKTCGGYGLNIILKHGDGTYTRYNHLSEIDVTQGSSVSAGQVIGKSGNTGKSGGPHLDLKVYFSENFGSDVGKPSYDRDPLVYLPKLQKYNLLPATRGCENSPVIISLRNEGAEISFA